MAFVAKTKEEVLRQALATLSKNTSITSTGPGSVARALTEAVTSEIGDLYNIMDFNLSLSVISTARGRALDLLGTLYDTRRKTLSELASIDKSLGAFYFYLDSPAASSITVPAGTRVYTDNDSYIGQRSVFQTTEAVTFTTGSLRRYATIRPVDADSIFNVGPESLTTVEVTQPSGNTIRCTNPKAIEAQVAYEDDESYRTRIIKAVRTAAGGTSEAVRFAGLGVAGVRDVAIRDAVFGLGSFEALVVTEDNAINGPIVRAAAAAMELVRPVGVRMFVRQPELLPTDVHASFVLRPTFNADAGLVARRVEIAILRYLNTLLVGSTLIYNQLINSILSASDAVVDVTLTRFAVNGEEVLRKNYLPEGDQQVIPGEVKATIAV